MLLASASDHKSPDDCSYQSAVSSKDPKCKPEEQEVMEHFHHWDSDGSGRITEDELRYILVQLGMCPNDVHKIFIEADTNGDGVLDYEEFVKWAFGGGHDLLRQVETHDHHTHEVHALDPQWHPLLVNLRKRFPHVDDRLIQDAIEQAEGHGGTAVKILKARGIQGEDSLIESFTPGERKQFKQLANRFRDASSHDIAQAMVQSEGHFGLCCDILRAHPSSSAIKNLLQRFPDASEADVLQALTEAEDHAGKAASLLHKKFSEVGAPAAKGKGDDVKSHEELFKEKAKKKLSHH